MVILTLNTLQISLSDQIPTKAIKLLSPLDEHFGTLKSAAKLSVDYLKVDKFVECVELYGNTACDKIETIPMATPICANMVRIRPSG